MATVSNTLALEDKMTQTLTSIQKAGIENIQTFTKMSDELEKLKKSLENAEKVNPEIVKTDMYADAVEGLERMENKLYDVSHGQDTFAEANEKTKLSITELNQALELCNKAWSGFNQLIGEAQKWSEADKIQQTAEIQLETVMRQRMDANEDMIQSIKNLTAEQQQLGIIGDEVQLSGAKQVATFLKSDKVLQSLIPAMNDLAANQYGYNVTSSEMVNIGNMVGKVMQGQTGALTRAGITFSEAEANALKYGNEEQRAAVLAQIITNNVGDMNEALANTPYGKIQQANNALGDLQETLGEKVTPYFAAFKQLLVQILTPAVQWFADNMDWLAPIIISVGVAIGIITAILTVYIAVQAISTLMTTLFGNAAMMAVLKVALLIIIIAAIIGVLLYFWNTNDEVAYAILFLWDSLQLGAMALWLGVQTAFYGILLIGQYLWLGMQGVVLGLMTAWYGFETGIESVKVGVLQIIQGMYNGIVNIVNSIIDVLNLIPGVNIDHAEYATFADEALSEMSEHIVERNQKLQDMISDMEGTTDEISNIQNKLSEVTSQGATDIQNKAAEMNATRDQRVKDREKFDSKSFVSNALSNATGGLDLDSLTDDIIGNNGSNGSGGGSKAIKTTSADEVNISDDDLQFLLDIATRDYKLTYQQVTPNITMTFGDIKETADVDVIANELANKLEEIYDGNLQTV